MSDLKNSDLANVVGCDYDIIPTHLPISATGFDVEYSL